MPVPDGDLLLHAGDHTWYGTLSEMELAADWLRSLPHRHKVVIAGNHDFCLQGGVEIGRRLFAPMTYLQDETVEIEGLRIYGSPWTPIWGGEWAFQKPRGPSLTAVWDEIPADTQLLITHGPAAQRMDWTFSAKHAGCAGLRRRVSDLKPLLHLFGHIHEGYGVDLEDSTYHVNGSCCAVGYIYKQPPHVFHWDGTSLTQVTSHQAAEPLWTYLVERFGQPTDLRECTEAQWKSVVHLGHAFWLEEREDGVGFVPPTPGEPLAPTPGRYPLSFGVKIPGGWLELLCRNSWPNGRDVLENMRRATRSSGDQGQEDQQAGAPGCRSNPIAHNQSTPPKR